MIILLLATTSPDKIREIRSILKSCDKKFVTPTQIKIKLDVKETGKTFMENAVIKAKAFGNKSGILTLAEDSGLEVDYLDGRPGIYSARYHPGTDIDRINKLLNELNGVPKEKRSARYRTSAALYDPVKQSISVTEGKTEGYITQTPEGTGGFGYDPVFFSKELGKTFGIATDDEKNSVSHRGRAIRGMLKYL